MNYQILSSNELGLSFHRAIGTRLLAEKVSQKLTDFGLDNYLYLQENALETHLTQCKSPKIILLATHGVTPEVFVHRDSDFHASASFEDYMLLYGLAFAGANSYLEGKQLPSQAGKGFAMSQDIANLDLFDTELAILSACGTGTGFIQNGDGVFGLRRAFTVAGCKTLIMSLLECS